MLKQRIVSVMVGIALLLATIGAAGVVADTVGFSVTSQAQACGGGGGNC